MKNNKFIQLFICLNLILIALAIISVADANTTITKKQNIIIRTKDKKAAKQLKQELDKKIIKLSQQ